MSVVDLGIDLDLVDRNNLFDIRSRTPGFGMKRVPEAVDVAIVGKKCLPGKFLAARNARAFPILKKMGRWN